MRFYCQPKYRVIEKQLVLQKKNAVPLKKKKNMLQLQLLAGADNYRKQVRGSGHLNFMQISWHNWGLYVSKVCGVNEIE